MVKRSRLELTSGQEGDNAAVPIPPVDRGRGDPRNIIGIITDRDVRILCKSGILKGSLHANSLICTSQRLLTDAEINRTESLTLRQAVNQESNCDGQEYVRCNCAGIKRCETNRCRCFKNKIQCSNRCQGSLVC